jgi:hydrogenase expression/formation protein HypE
MMRDTHVALAHGNGGRLTRELIDEVFAPHLASSHLDVGADPALLGDLDRDQELMVTTDGFTVQPLEFPGGDIGMLAVHGTVNDLAVSGAVPRYLSFNVFVEEGLAIELLDRIVASLGRAAREANVCVVAADVKVLRRGEGGGLYLATTGIGVRPRSLSLGISRIQPGDVILLSGPIGAHGITVLLAREQFDLHTDLKSDVASVLDLTLALREFSGLRFMRDPTRGGLATVMHEIARMRKVGVRLNQKTIRVQEPVRSVCEMLGYDPYYLACEGRVVAVIASDQAEAALRKWRELPAGREAALIGHIDAECQRVTLVTDLGGARYMDELEDDPLPRIC